MAAKLLGIKAIEREAFNVRSSGDARKRVDAYFVCYTAQWPDGYVGDWVCKFEVERGLSFSPKLYASQAEAIAERGFTI